MKTYISPKVFLLFIFGLLIVIRGINAEEEKIPPKTLQIGISSLHPPSGIPDLIAVGVKHRVPEEECTRKTKNGDKLKMHYRYLYTVVDWG